VFNRGSDGNCTQLNCDEPEGSHVNFDGVKFCRGYRNEPCCCCYWNGESERDRFLQKACKACQKRRKQWGGATTHAKFDAREAEEEAKRKAAAEKAAAAEAEAAAAAAAARAEVGLAPSASDAELARRKADLEGDRKRKDDAARAVENALAAQKIAVEMSEYTYTATWGKCNHEFCRKAKSDHFGTARRCYDPQSSSQKVATATAAYTQAQAMLTQWQAELAQRISELEAEAEAKRMQEEEAKQKAKAEAEAKRMQEEAAKQ
jgi:hypothetical protein